ncbi:MAG: hypothetical protein K0U47_01750 [Epsilonproteobacteria bacterium]|nr:hypothetical protein [Campylobacterota bacterium]
MYIKLALIAAILSGCGEVDREALKAMNAPKNTTITKIESNLTKPKLLPQSDAVVKKVSVVVPKEVNKSVTLLKTVEKASQENVTDTFTFAKTFEPQKVEPPQSKETALKSSTLVSIEQNKTVALPVVRATKKFDAEVEKYTLALQELEKKIALAKLDTSHELSLAKLEQEKVVLLKGKEIELAKAKRAQEVALAKIALEKTQTIERTKQMQHENNRQNVLTQNKQAQEIAKIQEHNHMMLTQKKLELYKIAAVVIGILLLLILMIFFLLRRGAQESKVKMHEDSLNQQLQLQMLEQQGKNLDKMLEIVASKEISKSVEKELLLTIKDSQKKTLIFDEKPKRSLIFRK